ncbi:FBD-associated F-box protein At5g56370-like isoform X2 [Oryza glaberrima]|nr:FBD-associated F-box protein At5g56370-like isoform X2 [Oryza glaberrima]
MSFLSVQEAVQICMLSTRWQHLWKSLPCVRINAMEFSTKKAFINFTNLFLLNHGPKPLDAFHLSITRSLDPIDFDDVDLWIFDVLSMEVKVLSIDLDHTRDLHLDPFIFRSSFLKRLHLASMNISEDLIRQILSCCKQLEDMEIIHCSMQTNNLLSQSLRKLKMIRTDACDSCVGVYEDLSIVMPSLRFLCLDARGCRVPILAEVSSVERASIILGEDSLVDNCGIIQALSNTMELEILAPGTDALACLLRRDLGRCYVFSKLKALSLDDWCLAIDYKSLLYFLAHSPILEKLSLILKKFSLKASEPPETTFRCQNLKYLKVEYDEKDARVCSLMGLIYDVAPFIKDTIEIKRTTVSSIDWVFR